MTNHFVETLLFTSVAVNAALLIYFAGVNRKIMDVVDGATFKNLTALLVRYSSKSPFMILVLNLPLIIAVPYYYFYGFSNWWMSSGLVLWLVSGSLAKIFKLPVYKAIATFNSDDVLQLNEMRRKLNIGNIFQAICYSAAVILIALGLLQYQL